MVSTENFLCYFKSAIHAAPGSKSNIFSYYIAISFFPGYLCGVLRKKRNWHKCSNNSYQWYLSLKTTHICKMTNFGSCFNSWARFISFPRKLILLVADILWVTITDCFKCIFCIEHSTQFYGINEEEYMWGNLFNIYMCSVFWHPVCVCSNFKARQVRSYTINSSWWSAVEYYFQYPRDIYFYRVKVSLIFDRAEICLFKFQTPRSEKLQ